MMALSWFGRLNHANSANEHVALTKHVLRIARNQYLNTNAVA